LEIKNTFSKAERLCSKKWIEELYKEGKSFRVYPLKVTFLAHNFNTESAVTIMVSSPKYFFKDAHERNLTKRRMRESYRKNKHNLLIKCKELQLKYFISFQYANKKIESFQDVESAMIKAIAKIELGFVKPTVNNKNSNE
jgi:ribonuclease P protein component